MSGRVELDESKLSAWLGELSLEESPPAQLRSAKLGPLWSFLGLAKTGLGLPEQQQNQRSTSPEISIFPSTAASEDLQQTKVSQGGKLSIPVGFVKLCWWQCRTSVCSLKELVQARVDNLTRTLAQLQRQSDDLHAEVRLLLHQAFCCVQDSYCKSQIWACPAGVSPDSVHSSTATPQPPPAVAKRGTQKPHCQIT